MTSLKVLVLLVLTTLLLFSTTPIETKVVKSLKECSEFFFDGEQPNIPGILEKGSILDQNRYKPICQTFKNTTTFATLYDTVNKIPVFSAFKYKGNCSGQRPDTWLIEPQLENITDDNNMRRSSYYTYQFQAGTIDYTNNSQRLDKGHLLPFSYGTNETERNSTFTLTNIVPQVSTFNQGSWKYMEQCVKCVLDKHCINNNSEREGFVVVGAQPSSSNKLNNRVNIPSSLWSAFCCYSSTEKKWLASAHWGENVTPINKYLQTITLADLYTKLGERSDVFPGTKCPLNTTVTQFYPRLKKTCTCPPRPKIKSTTSKTTSSTTTISTTTASTASTTKTTSTTTKENNKRIMRMNKTMKGMKKFLEMLAQKCRKIWNVLKNGLLRRWAICKRFKVVP